MFYLIVMSLVLVTSVSCFFFCGTELFLWSACHPVLEWENDPNMILRLVHEKPGPVLNDRRTGSISALCRVFEYTDACVQLLVSFRVLVGGRGGKGES